MKGTIFCFGVFLFFLATYVSGSAYGQTGVPIEKIWLGYDSVISASESNLGTGEIITLSRRHNRIAFEMADSTSGSFSYYLEGYDKGFSQSTQLQFKEYTNLPGGRYAMHIKYVKPNGETVNEPGIKVRILPYWFLSPAAVTIYFIFLILAGGVLFEQLRFRFAKTQYQLEQIINARTEELIFEKEKTEKLLSNVLPKNTADEIMAKGKAAKIKYNFVTVLFSDIQGFTKIAEEMNPEILIDELDKFFFHFDSVVEKYGIEKIKTIGDAYMCAGGIPDRNRTNPVEVILAALEMQRYMDRLKAVSEVEGMKYWDIRIGIHTGTVVAGVVGHKKLTYDIWGDTVNTASRMESSGEAGKINISGTTYEFVKEFFICQHRGKMPVKYKGELDMYFVEGIREELRDENSNPNPKFILRIQMLKLQDIEEYVIKMFEDEAPLNLYFHNGAATRALCNQVDLLAHAEKIQEEDYIHLRLAAIFLYTGYITDYEKPAEAACSLVGEILPKYNFTKESVETVSRLIADSFAATYASLSECILHDARYDYLGRVDFINLTEKLLRQESEFGHVQDRKKWFEEQEQVLLQHEFLTTSGRVLRNISADEQVMHLRELANEGK